MAEPAPQSMSDTVLVGADKQGPVLRLTLQNPPANALSIALMQALLAQVEAAGAEPSVRVIIISAAGKLFSGGHDLKEMTARRIDPDGGHAFFQQTFALCSRLMLSIANSPKPVIAEVDGIATAAGCQLVATCDLAIVSERARFGVNGIDVGLFCTTPAVALTRSIGRKHAMEMLLTGEMIDAATALRFGLVNSIVPAEELKTATHDLAMRLAAKSPAAIGLGKRGVLSQTELALADAYAAASEVMVANMIDADAEEGIAAFFDKRQPKWR